MVEGDSERNMESRLDFRYSIPRPLEGPLVELSAEEAEKLLLKRLDEAKADPTEALWQLAHFYKQVKQHEKALERLRQLMQRLPDPEQKAQCVLTMGQAMEQVGDYRTAVRYYKEALALEPTHTFTWYLINNNLGFSLNTLGQFEQGENYCRKAIEAAPTRPNAHKNLGIALAGRGEYREAARSFVTATQADAADARAFHLLQDLLRKHPELEYEFEAVAESCQKAVEFAAKHGEERKPVVLRGWRKHLFLLRMKLRSIWKRIQGG